MTFRLFNNVIVFINSPRTSLYPGILYSIMGLTGCPVHTAQQEEDEWLCGSRSHSEPCVWFSVTFSLLNIIMTTWEGYLPELFTFQFISVVHKTKNRTLCKFAWKICQSALLERAFSLMRRSFSKTGTGKSVIGREEGHEMKMGT